ncbi:MAG: hypothetical protein ACOYNL_07255 [Rickettsiales bacterium]
MTPDDHAIFNCLSEKKLTKTNRRKAFEKAAESDPRLNAHVNKLKRYGEDANMPSGSEVSAQWSTNCKALSKDKPKTRGVSNSV